MLTKHLFLIKSVELFSFQTCYSVCVRISVSKLGIKFPYIYISNTKGNISKALIYITLIFVEILRLHYTLQHRNIHIIASNAFDKAMFRPSIDHSNFSAQHKNIHALFSVLKLCNYCASKVPFRNSKVLNFDNGRYYLSEYFISLFPF